MQPIIDLLASIGEGITTALDFLGGLIEDLVTMAKLLADGMLAVPQWLGMFFPAELVIPIVGVLAIVVIYKIIGREG